MTKTIYKYPLEVTDLQIIKMPYDAQILTVQVQRDTPCLWALVTPDNESDIRTIEIFGTGHPVSEDMGVERVYIGTFQLREGALVFHVFENTGA